VVGPDDLYTELVLRCVEQVPLGRATSYGAIAAVVHDVLGKGGPRQVGSVMKREGAAVTWWRVVHADGTISQAHRADAHQAYLEEGTPLRPSGAVDMTVAFFQPLPPALPPAGDDGRHD
jgi:alkylated DNA nucleotide flippase Atl1